jgi:hypothetical protein
MSSHKTKQNNNKITENSNTKDTTVERALTDDISPFYINSSSDSEDSDMSFSMEEIKLSNNKRKSFESKKNINRVDNLWMKLYYVIFKSADKLGEIKLRLNSIQSLKKVKLHLTNSKLMVSRVLYKILHKYNSCSEINESNNPLRSSFILKTPKPAYVKLFTHSLKKQMTNGRGFRKSQVSTEFNSRDSEALKQITHRKTSSTVIISKNPKSDWTEIMKQDELHKVEKYITCKENIAKLSTKQFYDKFSHEDLNGLKHDIKAYERVNFTNYLNVNMHGSFDHLINQNAIKSDIRYIKSHKQGIDLNNISKTKVLIDKLIK